MKGAAGKIYGVLQRLLGEEKGLTALPVIIGAVSVLAVAGSLANAVLHESGELSQAAEHLVHEAVQGIQGTLQFRDSVTGTAAASGENGTIGQLMFAVALASNDGSIDFTPPFPSKRNTGISAPGSENVLVISYSDKHQSVENIYWTLEKCGEDNGNNLLEGGELFKITIGGSNVPGESGGNLVDALGKDLSTDTPFSIEVKAARRTLLCLERQTPSYIEDIMTFHN